jgi:TPR repeat protein
MADIIAPEPDRRVQQQQHAIPQRSSSGIHHSGPDEFVNEVQFDRLTLDDPYSSKPPLSRELSPYPSETQQQRPTYTDSPYVQKPDVDDNSSTSNVNSQASSTHDPNSALAPHPQQQYYEQQQPYRGHSPYPVHSDVQRSNNYRPSPNMAAAPRPMYNGEDSAAYQYGTPHIGQQSLPPPQQQQQQQWYWDEYSQQYVPAQPYPGQQYGAQDYYRSQQMMNYPPQDQYAQQQQQQQYEEYMSQQQAVGSTTNEVLPPIGKRPGKRSQFPPPTLENLSHFRAEARATSDPNVQLNFAKFLVEAIPQVCTEDPDQKRVKKIREGMANEAQRIVKKLAAQSNIGKPYHSEAQFFLANCYGSGTMGLTVDHEKAFNCYVQASKQSHPAATYRTAVCYEVGAGTKRDHARSILFYRKAANLGDTPAMYKLGMILLKGFLSQQKNPREGISWLKRAAANADEENPHSLHELGLAYEKEGIPSVIADEKYARELFTQAAQFGYAPSQFKLGCCYEYGQLTCPVDPRRSIAWYSRAAEQGDVEAELALSGWYLTGSEGVLKQSDTEAYLWARKAADKGYAKAEYAVGYYTETGIGVKTELDEARRWYMRAAAQGNKRAMQRLTELKKFGNARPQQRQKHTRGANGAPTKQDSDCTIM